MEKRIMTMAKLLESVILAVFSADGVKKVVLASAEDGAIFEAATGIELAIQVAEAGWKLDWKVLVITAKQYKDCFTVIFNPGIQQN